MDFVSQAIREYAASIDGEKNQDVLTDRIINSYRACTRNDMNRLSAMVFKIAVELAKANYILGANIIDMTDEEMEELNARARYAVRCNYGFFSIEQAVKEGKQLVVKVAGRGRNGLGKDRLVKVACSVDGGSEGRSGKQGKDYDCGKEALPKTMQMAHIHSP